MLWTLNLNCWSYEDGRQPYSRLRYSLLPASKISANSEHIPWDEATELRIWLTVWGWVGSCCDLHSEKLIKVEVCVLQRCCLCDEEEDRLFKFLKITRKDLILHISFLFFKLNVIGVWLLYNAVLDSTAEQNESATHVRKYRPFWVFFPFKSLQCLKYQSLCYTACSHELSILHII